MIEIIATTGGWEDVSEKGSKILSFRRYTETDNALYMSEVSTDVPINKIITFLKDPYNMPL